MNTAVIENRKTVTVAYSLAASSALDQKMYVQFKPDEMIVKQVTINNTSAGVVAFNMFSDLTNDTIFSAAVSATSVLNQNCDLHFPLYNQVSSIVKFEARNQTTGVPLAGVTTTVAFQIEFVKYAPKPVL
jgi:hypothetical protein